MSGCIINNHTSCSKRTFYLTKTTRSVAILTNDYFSNYLPFHITTSLLRLGKGIKRERGEGSSRGLAVRALGLFKLLFRGFESGRRHYKTIQP